MESIKATVIRENQAIRLRARKEFQDRSGVHRVTGEEWLVRKVGAYVPAAHEEVVDIVNAFVLTDKVGDLSRSSRLRSASSAAIGRWPADPSPSLCRRRSTCVPFGPSRTWEVASGARGRSGW